MARRGNRRSIQSRAIAENSPFAWILAACRRVAVLAVVVLVIKWYSGSRNTDRRSVDSLIVLPFVNLSPSPANEYFAAGLTEELTADLARVQGLRVVACTTAFQFQGKPQDIRKIGQQLNVASVLEGSVRWQGSQVKITAQLNGTAGGYHLWSHTYEGDARDVFRIQEQVARQIADALNRQLRQSDLPRPGTENLAARNLYLEGLHSRKTLELFPHTSLAIEQMAAAYEHLNDLPNAVASWRQVDDLQQDGILRVDALLEGSHGTNWPAHYWKTRLEWEKQKSLPDDYGIAAYLARLGDKAGALDALERSYAKRNPSLIYVRHDPYFDFLENEPRYKRLIASLHLN